MSTAESLEASLTALLEAANTIDEKIDLETLARMKAVDEANKARQEGDRTRGALTLTVIIGLVVALMLGGIGVWSGVAAHDANTKSDNNLVESRVGGCQQDNIRIAQHNNLVDATEAVRVADQSIQGEIDAILQLSTAPQPGATLTDAQQQRLAAFLQVAQAQQKLVLDKLDIAESKIQTGQVALRDCSITGIEKYLAN